MEDKHTVEIERCWLIDQFPTGMNVIEIEDIYQSYLSISPEVRIRKLTDRYHGYEQTYALTIKGPKHLSRTEVELPISSNEYEALEAIAPYRPIHKIRRTYELDDGLRLECNAVEPDTDDFFMYADIEFPSEEAANEFVKLSFLGEEVTGNPNWIKDLRARPKTN